MQKLRILVRFPNWLGDLVMSTGFLDMLMRLCPGCEVDAIVKKSLAPLLDFDRRINRVFPVEAKKPIVRGQSIASDVDQPYDLIFLLPRSISSALMTRPIPAKKRIGYSFELRGFLLTDRYRFTERGHRVFEYVELGIKFFEKYLAGEDIDFDEILTSVKIGFDFNIQDLQELTSPIITGDKYIVMNLVSEASSRTLPIDYSRSLIENFLHFVDYNLIFSGLPKQRTYVEQILETFDENDRLINIVGRTGLMELVKVIQGASLMVTVDSGPAHLSNSLSVMTFDLSGPDDPNITEPFNSAFLRIFRSDVDCAPCVKNTCKRGDNICLSNISIDMIRQEARKFLSNS